MLPLSSDLARKPHTGTVITRPRIGIQTLEIFVNASLKSMEMNLPLFYALCIYHNSSLCVVFGIDLYVESWSVPVLRHCRFSLAETVDIPPEIQKKYWSSQEDLKLNKGQDGEQPGDKSGRTEGQSL